MNDFNIKTETIKEGKSSVGKFVIGKRNERGKMLVTFSEKYKNGSYEYILSKVKRP